MIELLLASWLASLAPPGTPSGDGTPPRLRSGSIANGDYPSAAIRAREQGSVRIILNVAPYGGVTNCRVDRSSGSVALDVATCQLATQRFKFDPGRNAGGQAVASTYAQTVRWVLPNDDSEISITEFLPVFAAGEMRMAMAQDSMGMRCGVEMRGSAFSMGVDLLCPPGTRVALDELMQDTRAILTVTTLTPEGEAPVERRLVRGILIARVASDLEVSPDGTLASCRDVDVPGPRGSAAPSFCQAANSPYPAFRPDAAGQSRRGRVQIEIYRAGAPET